MNQLLLQAFNWESHRAASPSWWQRVADLVPQMARHGFTAVWLPPASASIAPQGYLPQDLHCLDSAYGSEQELRGLIARLHEAGILAVADIVINHRAGTTQDDTGRWTRFDGTRLGWDESAVTSDSGGKGGPSSGEVFEGVANIDHGQTFVREDLKEWLRWLREDVGFDGLRFDYAKGYSAAFVKEYVEASQPKFVVGEYWDTCAYEGQNYLLSYNQDAHRQRIVDWLDGAGDGCAAFDFTTKALLQEAVRERQWGRLRDAQGRPPGLVGLRPAQAVTFVDNHDTGSTQAHWPFPSHAVLQGYAYILTHPGSPTVFYDHLFEWGSEVREGIGCLLKCRGEGRVTSTSPVEILRADSEVYVARVGDILLVVLGSCDMPAIDLSQEESCNEGRTWQNVARGWPGCDYGVWILKADGETLPHESAPSQVVESG